MATAVLAQYLPVLPISRILPIPSPCPRSSNLLKDQYEDNLYSSISSTPWIAAGMDLTKAFAGYRKAAHQLSTVNPLNNGQSLQEILLLAGVLLLCPSQHSEAMMAHLDKVDEVT
ncbi:hypothetical protein G6F31_021091 [Rhizopus arrhizus]|nr:hypothetical protein G6F31_021091 [Rhizopus arrhizus]